jgi:Diacylglycerol kinase catalytic domain
MLKKGTSVRTIALINSRAGSVGADGARRMRSALSGVGLDHAEILEFDHDAADAQLRRIQEVAPDLVIVWGGDGTHRSVLDTLGRHSSQVLLLPGGTMNLLTKWLHGGRPWEHVLWSVLGSPKPRILPAGRVDDMLFFCAMIAGVPAQLAAAREDVRRGDIGRAIQDTGTALSSVHSIHLAASFGRDPGHPDEHFPTGNVVGALVGPLARNERMEVAWLSLESAWSALEFAWASFASEWRDRPGMLVRPADSLLVENVDGLDIPAMIDGERIAPRTSFKITLVEEAATCLVAGSTA